MPQFNNAMEVFKLLDMSNCRKCNKPTCLAFAAAVFLGQKQLEECPHLDRDVIAQFSGQAAKMKGVDQDLENRLTRLKKIITTVDLPTIADRLGARFAHGKLILKCLGKDFSIDTNGNITTDIHVHAWIAIPVFNYIIRGAGTPPEGNWVPFRELEGGKTWYRLFGQRCEKPLKRVADTYTDLFEDMIRLFNGRRVEKHYQSDISLVLHPLPKIPILICYWKPEDVLESSLNVFFDATAEENLNIESIYTLATGLVIMFEKLTLRHGFHS